MNIELTEAECRHIATALNELANRSEKPEAILLRKLAVRITVEAVNQSESPLEG